MAKEISRWLLIGVGGLGSKIVSKVDEELQLIDPSVAVTSLCIDTDSDDLARNAIEDGVLLTDAESIKKLIESIPTNNEARIALEKVFVDFPSIKKYIENGTTMEGMGQIYELAWLIFEAGGRDKIFEGICRHIAATSDEPTNVIVASSLAGATGAALTPRITNCLQEIIADQFHIESMVGVFLSTDCFIRSGLISSTQVRSIQYNEAMSLRDLASVSSNFERVHMVKSDRENTRSLQGCIDIAVDVIANEIQGREIAKEQFGNVDLIIQDGNFLIHVPELPDLGAEQNKAADKQQASGSNSSKGVRDQNRTDEFVTVPNAIQPRIEALRSIFFNSRAEFALHTQRTIEMLQVSLEEQIPRKPNDADELAKWEVLVKTLEISRDTLSVLHQQISNVKENEPNEESLANLATAFEAAAEKLKAGCAYLDKETQGDGHYAKLHKVGVCLAVGGVLSVASGASVVAAAAGVGAIFYGKDFAKSAFGLFSGGNAEGS